MGDRIFRQRGHLQRAESESFLTEETFVRSTSTSSIGNFMPTFFRFFSAARALFCLILRMSCRLNFRWSVEFQGVFSKLERGVLFAR